MNKLFTGKIGRIYLGQLGGPLFQYIGILYLLKTKTVSLSVDRK